MEYVRIKIDVHSRAAFAGPYLDDRASGPCRTLLQSARYYRGQGLTWALTDQRRLEKVQTLAPLESVSEASTLIEACANVMVRETMIQTILREQICTPVSTRSQDGAPRLPLLVTSTTPIDPDSVWVLLPTYSHLRVLLKLPATGFAEASTLR